MSRTAGGSFKKINLLISTTPALRATRPHLRGFAQRVGNGHAARSEICNRQSSGTQQRRAISSAIALADCTWLLDIGDGRMRIGDVQRPVKDFLCKAPTLGLSVCHVWTLPIRPRRR